MQSRASQLTLQTTRTEIWRGILIGLVPLGVLLGIVGLSLAVTALARALTAGQGFDAERAATAPTLAVGLVIALVGSIVALVWAWRRMRAWQQAGNAALASGAFWALAATSLVMLLPVLLAFVIPQHPAP